MLDDLRRTEPANASWADRQRAGNRSSPYYQLEKQQGAQPTMLAFEFDNGDLLALPYALLVKIEYRLSEGIRLEWGTDILVIEGQRLQPLFHALVEQRVKAVIEAPDEESDDPDAAVITRVRRG